MLSRATQAHHLPSISMALSPSSHARCAFNFNFTQTLPTLSFISPSQHLKFQTLKFPIFCCSFSSTPTSFSNLPTTFFRKFCLPTSSFALRSLSNGPSMMGRSSLSGKASLSTSSSSQDGREILVQHLLVKENDLNLLVELQKRISEGEDLSDLAVEYSLCPSKDDGGMLGWVRKGQMVPEFEEAAFSAPLNTVVKCKTKFGWHLLQVLSEREELVLQEIQPKELHERLKDPGFIEEAQLIDVREPEEVARASLPCFKVLPLQQFGSWGPEITTKFDPDKDTYVMCHHGVRSLQVARWLQSQGFKKVFNVAGGIHAYAVNVDPSIPTY